MKNIFKIITIICFFTTFSFSQNYILSPNFAFPVSILGVSILNPLTGGINIAQAYKIQIDGNGAEDLVLFDKYIGRIFTYIYDGTNYIYIPKYEYLFPKIFSWLSIIDYDGDGKKDIFTSPGYEGASISYVRVYKNNSLSNSLTGFNIVTSTLIESSGFGDSDLNVPSSDIPSILDLDNDGDIDIVVHGGTSNNINFYRNTSIETTSIAGLSFQRYSSCWSKISISSNCDNITTTIAGCRNSGGLIDNLRTMHNGSSISISDINNDGTKDLLFGDTYCPFLYFLSNTGSNLNPKSTGISIKIPQQNPIKVNAQPIVSYIDLNNDNKNELLVSGFNSPYGINNPNDTHIIDYSASLHLLENNSNITSTSFNLLSNNFFQSQNSIDFGFDSNPEFIDYDADGDMDFIVGYRVSNSSTTKVGLKLFENIGNATVPAFNLINNDYLGLSTLLGATMIKPRFADINRDGALDLYFLNTLDATSYNIKYIINSALSNQPVSFVGNNILELPTVFTLGQNSNVFMYDLNKDDLIDILICKSDQSVVNYFFNIGTKSAPAFKRENNILGNLPYNSNHFENVIAIGKLTKEGSDVLLWHDKRGKIFIYPNFLNELTNFTTVDSIAISEGSFHKNMGTLSIMTLADLNSDGKSDLLLGSNGGGVRYFQNIFISTVISSLNEPTEYQINKYSIHIYPNPANTNFEILDKNEILTQIQIFNLQGNLIKSIELEKNKIHKCNVSDISNGSYFIKIYTNNYVWYQKIVINKN